MINLFEKIIIYFCLYFGFFFIGEMRIWVLGVLLYFYEGFFVFLLGIVDFGLFVKSYVF